MTAPSRKQTRRPSRASKTAPAARPVALSPRNGTALHHQVFLVIRERILSGLYPSGEMLPTEEALSQLFSVSRITVRTALANLTANGLIERRQGVGTFVSKHIEPAKIHAPMADLLAHIADVGRTTQVKLLELGFVRAPFPVQSQFECDANAVFQRAVRLRSMHNVPVFYVVTFIPENIGRRFTQKEMSGSSLLQLLRSKGYHFKTGKQVVSAVLADPTVAAALNVEVGAPLLQIRRIHHDEKGRPFEYSEMLASPSQFELQMTLDAEDMPA